MDLFGKKKKAAQKAQDEKRAASDRPKSMPPRPPSKPEADKMKAQEERPKGASPRPYNPPSPKDIKAAELLKQKMDQSKGQQEKQEKGMDYNRPPGERPKSLPPLKSPTSREAGKYPPSPSPQEKGMDYGRPPGASPMYPNPQEGQIKKARKDHFWDGHKKPMGGPTGYQPFNPSQDINSQYPRPSDPDEGGSMAKKPMRPKGPNSPGGAFPSNYELALRKQGIGEPQVSDKYGAGK